MMQSREFYAALSLVTPSVQASLKTHISSMPIIRQPFACHLPHHQPCYLINKPKDSYLRHAADHTSAICVPSSSPPTLRRLRTSPPSEASIRELVPRTFSSTFSLISLIFVSTWSTAVRS